MSTANLNFNYKNKGMLSERSQNARLFNGQEIFEGKEFFKNDEDTSNKFDIDAKELQDLMGKYKERGNDYNDIRYLEIKTVHQIISELKTNSETGLKDLTGREEVFGSNKIFTEPPKHFCSYVWEALKDLMVRILIVAAIVSILLGVLFSDEPSKDWIDGASIVVAVLVVVLVGSITDYQKEQNSMS